MLPSVAAVVSRPAWRMLYCMIARFDCNLNRLLLLLLLCSVRSANVVFGLWHLKSTTLKHAWVAAVCRDEERLETVSLVSWELARPAAKRNRMQYNLVIDS